MFNRITSALAAVASNVKARWTAKKFDIWEECQDDNRKSDTWISVDWIASNGKLYYGIRFKIMLWAGFVKPKIK